MKKNIFAYIALLLFAAPLFSCSKDELATTNPEDGKNVVMYPYDSAVAKSLISGAASAQNFTVNLKANQAYQYDLGVFGREEYAEVTRPPQHASVSRIERVGNNLVYYYTPEKNYTGTDQVEITSYRDSDGTHPQTITTTTITFQITNDDSPQ